MTCNANEILGEIIKHLVEYREELYRKVIVYSVEEGALGHGPNQTSLDYINGLLNGSYDMIAELRSLYAKSKSQGINKHKADEARSE